MKLRSNLLAASFIIFIFACSDNIVENDDYRLEFTGTYECVKVPASVFNPDKIYVVEVKLDSSSTDQVIINDAVIPVSEEGTFGPDFLDDMNVELRFDDDSIYLSTYYLLINGIQLPCTLVGSKKG